MPLLAYPNLKTRG